MTQHTLRTKRVYEPPSPKDGLRVLVDRLWPRGLSKAEAHIDLWLKDLAPSNELRRKFHEGEMEWAEFVKAYTHELAQVSAKEAATPLAESRARAITLLYASKDDEHNNAVALAQWLAPKLRAPSKKSRG